MPIEINPAADIEWLDPKLLCVKRPLGRGGFAVVYSATYGSDQRPVALKVLQPIDSQHKKTAASYERMFLREAACAKQHTHESLVRCFGVVRIPEGFQSIRGIVGSALGIVLELCEPYTTKTLIIQSMTENRRTYTSLQAYTWLAQVASALAYLHGLQPPIIHRDIKQENVLLAKRRDAGPAAAAAGSTRSGGARSTGGRLVAKLADLGIHVTVEQDRSVLLRRKNTLQTRSVHSKLSRAQSRAGSRGIDSAADGSTKSAGTVADNETPFYALASPTTCIPAANGLSYTVAAQNSGGGTARPSSILMVESSGPLTQRPASQLIVSPHARDEEKASPSMKAPTLGDCDCATPAVSIYRPKAIASPLNPQAGELGGGAGWRGGESMVNVQISPQAVASSAPSALSNIICAGSLQGLASGAGLDNGASGSDTAPVRHCPLPPPLSLPSGDGPAAGSVLSGSMSLQSRKSKSMRKMITINPDLVQPLGLESSFTSAARRVGSLLKSFQQTELRHMRQESADWVFALTGQAGSCMYMAPEVYCKLPYNEKADVFSFGVLMYELLARELLIISYFNTPKGQKLGMKAPDDYAAKVCEGFRPPRPGCLPDSAWSLIEACWHDDPVQRPPMEEVLARLSEISDGEEAQPTDPKGLLACGPGCSIQ